MSALRGFIAGTVAVSTVEVLVSSPGMAGRIGAAGDPLTGVIGRVVDPAVPAIGSGVFVRPAAIVFGDSGGGQKAKAKHKTLSSTKAKQPRSYASGARRIGGP